MRSSELLLISTPEVQEYLSANESIDEKKLLLAKKEILGMPSSEMANQLIGRRKAKQKFPSWYQTTSIVYPPSANLEQSSSEATAKFKAELIRSELVHCSLLVDLTGGFGVDTFFLGKLFSEAIHIEPNETVSAIAAHNHRLLGASILHVQQTAEEYLKANKKKVDLFFIDPSRRSESKKVFKLADCQPNIAALQDVLFFFSNFILTKASPLLDIQQALRELKHVAKVAVVSVENECKELLFLQKFGFGGEPIIETINLSNEGSVVERFVFTALEERAATVVFSSPLDYLYEPNASILKSGAFKLVAEKFGLRKLQANTHLYTSPNLFTEFPGRVFKIEALNPTLQMLKELLPEGKANVATRNYPLSAQELKKKLKLKDGGDKFVIGFSEEKRKSVVIATRIR
ncbi:MAG: THUMP-like domain-containing protein [Cyclobacteriaceae bacterium]